MYLHASTFWGNITELLTFWMLHNNSEIYPNYSKWDLLLSADMRKNKKLKIPSNKIMMMFCVFCALVNYTF